MLQVTNKAISRWETGEGFPDVMILPKLSSMLGVTVYDKRIRYILYKFLSALEEGIRGYISNHYNSMDKIKSLSMCFYANKVDTESINNACFQAKYVSHVRKVL
ncbi:MAG: hypothetical protein A2518_03355 [Tenericutes bacterium RIFOXYD12_FULL_36_9]|nr:MAG: hypothetical protein A2518_03355 [Tenericutes bacterium RIFOXYD12_FULL_36_9]